MAVFGWTFGVAGVPGGSVGGTGPFSILKNLNSRGIKRDKLNGTNQAEFAVFRRFSLIFADFRFSWELQHFGGADFRRKPQETADFRRKLQEIADFRRNRFVPFSLSLLIPPYQQILMRPSWGQDIRVQSFVLYDLVEAQWTSLRIFSGHALPFTRKAKITLRDKINLGRVNFMFVLKGIFGKYLKTTLQQKNNLQGKK